MPRSACDRHTRRSPQSPDRHQWPTRRRRWSARVEHRYATFAPNRTGDHSVAPNCRRYRIPRSGVSPRFSDAARGVEQRFQEWVPRAGDRRWYVCPRAARARMLAGKVGSTRHGGGHCVEIAGRRDALKAAGEWWAEPGKWVTRLRDRGDLEVDCSVRVARDDDSSPRSGCVGRVP